MSRTKDRLMTLEDLVVQAFERGVTNEKDIFSYVNARESASFAEVETICKDLFMFIEDYNNDR